jgi:pimeloyl-ACP methyl ester carboxylesterase
VLPRRRTDVPRGLVARQVALCALPPLGERVLARRRARLGAEGLIAETLAVTCADPARVSPGMRRLAVELCASRAAGPDSEAAYLEAARSVGLLVTRAAAYRAAIARVEQPVMVLQGALDRLAARGGLEQLRALRPDWPVHVLDDVGHVPQIEAPDRTAGLVLDWLSRVPHGTAAAPAGWGAVTAERHRRPGGAGAGVLSLLGRVPWWGAADPVGRVAGGPGG